MDLASFIFAFLIMGITACRLLVSRRSLYPQLAPQLFIAMGIHDKGLEPLLLDQACRKAFRLINAGKWATANPVV